ncbi:MAG TPA: 6,7-dimethyl-8-ribityllumazine synthase [Chloroflexota bacterium]|nr:6,7-dimethyl-8-ribityllumazine synthase [Chloroflexota bacterium]
MRELTGRPQEVEAAHVAIVAGRFNDAVTSGLVQGALGVLRVHGLGEDDLTLIWVPGSYEIPLVAAELARAGRYDAIIALGCVIQGSTRHADLVTTEVARGLAEVSRTYRLPVLFEVIAADSLEVALDRSGRKLNRGSEAAEAALQMISLLRQLRAEGGPAAES